MTKVRVLIGLGLLLSCLVASAKPVNISGVWERYPDPYAGGIDYPPPPGGEPDMKEPYASMYKATLKKRDEAMARGEPLLDASTRCVPEGMPNMMAGTYAIEIVQVPEKVVVIAEFLSQIRRIFIGDTLPPIDDISPSYSGTSAAKWQGNTLVVHTAGIREDVLFMNMPHSKNMKITERIRLTAPDMLEDHVTIDDPDVLNKPYVFTYGYRRDKGYRVVEYICDNNRYKADDKGEAVLKVAP